MDSGEFFTYVLLGFFVWLFYFSGLFIDSNCCMCGSTGNGDDCCPCPNRKYVDEVSEWNGYEPSGASSWKYMCERYKNKTNETFPCFIERD